MRSLERLADDGSRGRARAQDGEFATVEHVGWTAERAETERAVECEAGVVRWWTRCGERRGGGGRARAGGCVRWKGNDRIERARTRGGGGAGADVRAWGW